MTNFESRVGYKLSHLDKFLSDLISFIISIYLGLFIITGHDIELVNGVTLFGLGLSQENNNVAIMFGHAMSLRVAGRNVIGFGLR